MSLHKLLNKIEEKDEIEIRLGRFTKKGFRSGITSYMYHILMNILCVHYKCKKVKQHIKLFSNNIKRIEGKHNIMKTRKYKIDYKEYGIRVDLSKEKYIEKIPCNSKLILEKDRERIIFFDDTNFIKVDVTKDIVSDNIHYQAEIEFLRKPTIGELSNIIQYFSNINLKLKLYQKLVYDINKLDHRRRKSPELFSPSMPKSIKEEDIKHLHKYAITNKPDGVSLYLTFTINGNYYVGKTQTELFDINTIPSLIGSVILGEKMKNGDFIVYDILRYKFKNIQRNYIIKRYEILKIVLSELNMYSNIKLLPIFYKKSLKNNIEDVFEYIKNIDYKNDGIIFKPLLKPHYNKCTYKWKPPEDLTIDFSTYKNEDNTYSLYCYGIDSSKVLFTGTIEYPCSTNHIINFSNNIEDGSIIEYKYLKNNFIPVRIRGDKIKPNFIEIANIIWKDIHNPITKDKLLSLSMNIKNKQSYD